MRNAAQRTSSQETVPLPASDQDLNLELIISPHLLCPTLRQVLSFLRNVEEFLAMRSSDIW